MLKLDGSETIRLTYTPIKTVDWESKDVKNQFVFPSRKLFSKKNFSSEKNMFMKKKTSKKKMYLPTFNDNRTFVSVCKDVKKLVRNGNPTLLQLLVAFF